MADTSEASELNDPLGPQLAVLERRITLFSKAPSVTTVYEGGVRHVVPGLVPQFVSWKEVFGVRLAFAPTRYKRNRYSFDLLDAKGVSLLAVDNIHFKGLADFVERNAAFNALVRAAVQQVPAANPDARLYAGASALSYGVQGGFVLVALLVLLAILLNLVLPGALISGSTLIKIGLIALTLPLLLKWFVKARPQGLDWKADLGPHLPKE